MHWIWDPAGKRQASSSKRQAAGSRRDPDFFKTKKDLTADTGYCRMDLKRNNYE